MADSVLVDAADAAGVGNTGFGLGVELTDDAGVGVEGV